MGKAIVVEKPQKGRKRRISSSLLLYMLSAGLVVGMILSIMIGAASISLEQVLLAFWQYNAENVQHYTILSVRLPRALAAAAAGACFAVSGAIMQGLTRNPLASPSIMGVSAGSSLAIVLAIIYIPMLAYYEKIILSMLGAAIGSLLVYSIGAASAKLGGAGAVSHVRLALAGSCISALFGALSEGLQLYYGQAQNVMLWYAAGIAGIKWMDVLVLLPALFIGGVIAASISTQLSVLALGEDAAAGLGNRSGRTKLLGALAVLLLTGGAVAVCGPISFIGLIVPHLVRYIAGVDYRYILPCSAFGGALLLLLADTGSRLVNMPRETPAGIITALIGVPFFLYLARKEGRVKV